MEHSRIFLEPPDRMDGEEEYGRLRLAPNHVLHILREAKIYAGAFSSSPPQPPRKTIHRNFLKFVYLRFGQTQLCHNEVSQSHGIIRGEGLQKRAALNNCPMKQTFGRWHR